MNVTTRRTAALRLSHLPLRAGQGSALRLGYDLDAFALRFPSHALAGHPVGPSSYAKVGETRRCLNTIPGFYSALCCETVSALDHIFCRHLSVSRAIEEKPFIAIKSIDAVIHMQENTHKVPKPVSQVVLSRTQLISEATRPAPHGASRLVQPMSAWSVKTLRAPSWYCRGARVYGHTTTTMHDMSTPPPSLPSSPSNLYSISRLAASRSNCLRHFSPFVRTLLLLLLCCGAC